MRLFLDILAYLFDTVTVAAAGDDFVALLVPCSVPVVVERTKVLRFVH